ncbi:MAG: AHH domain-containing protein [Myxococcota bacterium]|nr:AHH domain-containing protein [Myxococcota bacterium]
MTIRVVPPATYESAINAGGVYEEDDVGNVVVSDGSQYVTDDDGKQPDFGITVRVPGGSPSSELRRARQFSGPFDPLNPPQAVVSDLQGFTHKNKFGCWSYLIDDNEAHDRTSPVSPGTLQIFAYCANFWAAPGAQLTQYGVNLNTGEVRTHVPATLLSCSHQLGSYGDFRVCATKAHRIRPVWQHAERVEIRYTLHYDSLALIAFAEERAGHYVVNDVGAFYPRIAISPDWAVLEVYSAGAGYVPFPPGPFKYCAHNAPEPCLNDTTRKILRRNMHDAQLPKPPFGFQAHHIKEVMWCGTNDLSNGVFLPSQDTDPSEYEPRTHGILTKWWDRQLFTPDRPVPSCS